MKKFVVLTFIAVMYANSAFALVRLVKSCQIPQTRLTIEIFDNEGIGLIRKHNLSATLSDANRKFIASYAINPPPRIQSVSFARSPYTDKLTQGHRFSLAFPSTNFRHTSIMAVLPDKSVLTSDDVVCESF